jgi:hypothetical protein
MRTLRVDLEVADARTCVQELLSGLFNSAREPELDSTGGLKGRVFTKFGDFLADRARVTS